MEGGKEGRSREFPPATAGSRRRREKERVIYQRNVSLFLLLLFFLFPRDRTVHNGGRAVAELSSLEQTSGQLHYRPCKADDDDSTGHLDFWPPCQINASDNVKTNIFEEERKGEKHRICSCLWRVASSSSHHASKQKQGGGVENEGALYRKKNTGLISHGRRRRQRRRAQQLPSPLLSSFLRSRDRNRISTVVKTSSSTAISPPPPSPLRQTTPGGRMPAWIWCKLSTGLESAALKGVKRSFDQSPLLSGGVGGGGGEKRGEGERNVARRLIIHPLFLPSLYPLSAA